MALLDVIQFSQSLYPHYPVQAIGRAATRSTNLDLVVHFDHHKVFT